MTPQQRERYSRQLLFAEIGEAGQSRLLQSHAVIVGCGALGSFQAATLARAGAGKLTLIDRDFVETSNLQRQWLYDEQDAAQALPKAIAASNAILRINRDCATTPLVTDLRSDNAVDLLEDADLILDGTDNFETRYLINDFAVAHRIPWIYGGAVGSYGITFPVMVHQGPCFRCLYPDPPLGAQPTCDTSGVLGPTTSLVASLQAAEALKILSGRADAVSRQITTIDIWSGVLRQLALPDRDPECPCCVKHEFIYLQGACDAPISMCGRNAVQIHERRRPLDLDALAARLRPLGQVRSNDFALRFFLPPHEMMIFPDGRAIIKGTTDPGLARSLYARYIGA